MAFETVDDLLAVVVAAGVVFLAFKYLRRGQEASGTPSISQQLGFKPKQVSPEMIRNVHSAFPHIPLANIHYDLLRTGSADVTVNKLLERGYLDAPSAGYFRAFPPPPTQDTPPAQAPANPQLKGKKADTTLIEKFGLVSGTGGSDTTGSIPASEKGKARETTNSVTTTPTKWEDTPEKRAAALQKRKQEMILAARKRMLEKKKTEETAA